MRYRASPCVTTVTPTTSASTTHSTWKILHSVALARDYFLETIHRTLSLFFYISIYLSLNFSPRYSASVINFFIFLSLPFSISLFLYFATFVTRVWILLSHLECLRSRSLSLLVAVATRHFPPSALRVSFRDTINFSPSVFLSLPLTLSPSLVLPSTSVV